MQEIVIRENIRVKSFVFLFGLTNSCSQTLQLFGNLHGKMRANRLLIIARLKWRPNGIPLFLIISCV